MQWEAKRTQSDHKFVPDNFINKKSGSRKAHRVGEILNPTNEKIFNFNPEFIA